METSVVRISKKAARLLSGFNKGSVDKSIRFIWNKLSAQGKELNRWKHESGCKEPSELRKFLDKLFNENNRLREQLLEVKARESSRNTPGVETEQGKVARQPTNMAPTK